jgi:large subunit ribosomal protein L35
MKMPKMKTKSAAKKRIRITGTGNVKYKPAHKRHRLISKPTSMKRKARGTLILNESDATIILENYVPYARGRKKAKPNPTPAQSKAIKAAKAAAKLATKKPAAAAKKAPAKKSSVKKEA